MGFPPPPPPPRPSIRRTIQYGSGGNMPKKMNVPSPFPWTRVSSTHCHPPGIPPSFALGVGPADGQPTADATYPTSSPLPVERRTMTRHHDGPDALAPDLHLPVSFIPLPPPRGRQRHHRLVIFVLVLFLLLVVVVVLLFITPPSPLFLLAPPSTIVLFFPAQCFQFQASSLAKLSSTNDRLSAIVI